MKERKPLPPNWVHLAPKDFIDKWYQEQYAYCTYCNAAGLSQRIMHKSIERRHQPSTHFENVLEIGANHGEHLLFVKHTFKQYFFTDIEEFDSSVLPVSESRTGLIFKKEDACKLSFPNKAFDRVLCSCVLHHVQDPEIALMELRRVLKTNGSADLFVSSDPGFLFRLGRYLGPVREAKKMNLDGVKRLLDARDHRNHVAGLTRLIRHVFREDNVKERSYPFPLVSWNFSFWKVFHIIKK